jgi:hypothetical protein
VIVGDGNGCVNSSTEYVLISGIEVLSDQNISVYPNPSSGNFIVEFSCAEASENRLLEIDVVNMLGQKVFSSTEKITTVDSKKKIDLSDTAPGVYFVQIKSINDGTGHSFAGVRKKIIIAE